MPDSLLNQYVLAGGWTMALLLPAAIVALATAMRAAWLLRDKEVQKVARDLHPARPIEGNKGGESAAYAAALNLYGLLQPLSAVFVLASLIGMLGSFTAILAQPFPRGAAHLRQAMLPSIWGLSISVFSYAAFCLLRARVFRVEREILLPAMDVAQSEGDRA